MNSRYHKAARSRRRDQRKNELGSLDDGSSSAEEVSGDEDEEEEQSDENQPSTTSLSPSAPVSVDYTRDGISVRVRKTGEKSQSSSRRRPQPRDKPHQGVTQRSSSQKLPRRGRGGGAPQSSHRPSPQRQEIARSPSRTHYRRKQRLVDGRVFMEEEEDMEEDRSPPRRGRRRASSQVPEDGNLRDHLANVEEKIQESYQRLLEERGEESLLQGAALPPSALAVGAVAIPVVPASLRGGISDGAGSTLASNTKPRNASSVRPVDSCLGSVRVASWNVEWMYNFFKPGLPAELLPSNPNCGIVDTAILCLQIGGLMSEMNPDLVIIVEGPEYLEQMQEFVRLFLDDSYESFGGLDGDHQRIYILVKRDGPIRSPQLDEETLDYLSKEWLFDINGDLIVQSYSFTRVPLVVTAQVVVDGVERQVYFIGIHCKSKHVKRGEQLRVSVGSHENTEFIRKAVRNRKRIAAECARLRKCLDQCVFSKERDPLVIVAGDLNDGPGMDFFEEYYLLFDSVEALLGSPFYQKKLLQPILIHRRLVHPDDQWTAAFTDPIDGVENKRVLIDHICVSKAVYRRVGNAGIAHDLKEKYEEELRGYSARQSRVSDHAPCFIDAF